MNRFEELIKSVSAKPSIILHLGAGNCSEHNLYTDINPSHIIYVEPNRHLAEAAIDAFNTASHVKVIPHALAVKNVLQTLNIMNNRRFSSLLLPSELLDFYPNIKVNENVDVEGITLAKLCQDEKISNETDNLLIAEIQGMEKEIFPLAEADTLQRFKWIIIRSSVKNLYTPKSHSAQRSLAEVMQGAGFFVLAFEEDAPPFVNILCIRNDAAIDIDQIKMQRTDLLDTTKTLEQNLSKKIAELDKLQTNHARAIDELDGALASKSNELDKAKSLVQSIAAEREIQQQQVDKLATAVDDKSSELAEAHKQIQSFSAEEEGLLEQIRALSSTVDDKSSELAEVHKQIQSFSVEKENNLQKIIELGDSVKTKEKELTEMQQTLRISNKLVLKSDADLRDLQLQYRAALRHQEQQHTLLCELKEKLHQASIFYQKLNLQNLVLDADLLEQSDSSTVDSQRNDED